MDTNKLAGYIQDVVRDAGSILKANGHQLGTTGNLGTIHQDMGYPMRGFKVQIDGQEFFVGVWQEKFPESDDALGEIAQMEGAEH